MKNNFKIPPIIFKNLFCVVNQVRYIWTMNLQTTKNWWWKTTQC